MYRRLSKSWRGGKNLAKLNGLFDNIAKQNENLSKAVLEESSEDKLQVVSQYKFSFGLDTETENYLKEQTYKVHKTASKMYEELGQIFKETQEKLANNKNGVFYAWFTELGFNKNQVYRWINRYEFILSQNETIKNIIRSLPVTLSYEIANQNCPQALRDKVINGEIKTLQEFMEAKKLLISHVEEATIVEEQKDYFSILESDFNEFTKNYDALKINLSDKLKELPEDKQKSLAEEIEVINKKIEKLLKSL